MNFFCGCLNQAAKKTDLVDALGQEILEPFVPAEISRAEESAEIPPKLSCEDATPPSPVRADHVDQQDSLGWVNFLLKSAWPRFRAAANTLAHDVVRTELNEAIRSSKETLGLKIDIDYVIALDIGSKPPLLKNVRALHLGSGDSEGIELSASLEMFSGDEFQFELEVTGSVSGLAVNTTVGVSDFNLFGDACVLLAPLIDKIPVFAGGKLYFLDIPNLQLHFFGLKRVGSLLGPVISSAVQASLQKVLNSFVVPGGIYVPVATVPPPQLISIATPAPWGFMMVTVCEARGVFGGDWSIWSKETSDPSVTISLGSTSFVTSHHNNTSHPKWDPPETGFLPLHNHNQRLQISVSDVDFADHRDLLGALSDTVGGVYAMSKGKTWLQMELTEEGKKGSPAGDPQKMEVLLHMEYLTVVPLPSTAGMVRQLPAGQPHQFGGPRQLTQDFVPLLRVCTVRLMGMDCPEQYAGEIFYSIASVTVEAGAPPSGWKPEEKKESTIMKGFKTLTNALQISSKPGGTLKQPAMRTKKARRWGVGEGGGPKGSYLASVNLHSQLMIERLSRDKNMSFAEIAEVAGLKEEEVKMLVEMQRSLKAVWYQAFHRLLEYPGGKVVVEVAKEDKTFLGKVEVDLAEVEASPDKKKKVRASLTENAVCKDLVLAFEVELRGCIRADLQPPTGQPDFSAHLKPQSSGGLGVSYNSHRRASTNSK